MAVFLLAVALLFGAGSQFQDKHKLCEESEFKSKECKVHKKLEELDCKASSKCEK